MGTLGVAFVAGGSAHLFSGLIFLIPVRRKRSKPVKSFEDKSATDRTTC